MKRKPKDPCAECAKKKASLANHAERINDLSRASSNGVKYIADLEGQLGALREDSVRIRTRLAASEREVATLRGCNDSALTTLVQLAHGIKFGPPADWEPKP